MHRNAIIAAAGIMAILVVPRVGLADPPLHAEVHFGTEVGSPFPPPEQHDQSLHARDKIVPRTVVISAGGSITFEIYPFHQVAIYEAGTEPEDIEVGPGTLIDANFPCPPFTIPDFVIDDPDGRIARSPSLECEEMDWETPAGVFDEPGRYLMICTTAPHFLEADMFGWIIVK